MSDTPETDAETMSNGVEKLTGQSESLDIYQKLCDAVCEIQRLRRERDEARAAIPSGKWVAYEDHRQVHDAASRLLVAINKQLPIGCFLLISHEYYRLQNAIYGRKETK